MFNIWRAMRYLYNKRSLISSLYILYIFSLYNRENTMVLLIIAEEHNNSFYIMEKDRNDHSNLYI